MAHDLVQLAERPRLFVADGLLQPEELERLDAYLTQVVGELPRMQDEPFPPETRIAGNLPGPLDPDTGALIRRITEAFRAGDGRMARLWAYRVGAGGGMGESSDVLRLRDHYVIFSAELWVRAPAKGGALFFPRAEPAPLRIHPRSGRVVGWFNHRANGTVEAGAAHSTDPVAEGEGVVLAVYALGLLSASARRVEGRPHFADAGPDPLEAP